MIKGEQYGWWWWRGGGSEVAVWLIHSFCTVTGSNKLIERRRRIWHLLPQQYLGTLMCFFHFISSLLASQASFFFSYFFVWSGRLLSALRVKNIMSYVARDDNMHTAQHGGIKSRSQGKEELAQERWCSRHAHRILRGAWAMRFFCCSSSSLHFFMSSFKCWERRWKERIKYSTLSTAKFLSRHVWRVDTRPPAPRTPRDTCSRCVAVSAVSFSVFERGCWRVDRTFLRRWGQR